MKYVAMALQRWDQRRVESNYFLPTKLAPVAGSVGCLLVYDDVATLRKHNPECEIGYIRPAEKATSFHTEFVDDIGVLVPDEHGRKVKAVAKVRKILGDPTKTQKGVKRGRTKR